MLAGDKHADPDELAAPAGRPAGHATAVLQRDRASRRERDAVRRDGEGAARARAVRPRHLHADLDQGLLVIEDLGDERVVEGDPPAPIKERYETAVDALHRAPRPSAAGRAAGRAAVEYRIPIYDMDAFLIEAELLLDWFLPRFGVALPNRPPAFRTLWRETLQPAIDAPPTWVLRDYHSPNLLWLANRKEAQRIGILDFQDAVMVLQAYDLAEPDAVPLPDRLIEVEVVPEILRRCCGDDSRPSTRSAISPGRTLVKKKTIAETHTSVPTASPRRWTMSLRIKRGPAEIAWTMLEDTRAALRGRPGWLVRSKQRALRYLHWSFVRSNCTNWMDGA